LTGDSNRAAWGQPKSTQPISAGQHFLFWSRGNPEEGAQEMAGKTNIRSIRFSDELAELIDRQAGKTFTEKFENLITRCVWELPKKEEQLKRIQEQIKEEQERLYKFQKATEELRRLEQDIKTAEHYFKIIERRAKTIAGTMEKEA